MSSHGLVALIERSLQVRELNLSYCNLISSSLQKLKMLQVITLDHCSLDKANLSLVGIGCRELKDLSLSRCEGVTDVGVVGVVTAHTGLQRLDLTCCRNITDVALEAVATNCRGLLSLKMEDCISITAEGLVLIGEFCLSLEDLDLTGSKLNDDGLKSIARCTKLIFLKIDSCMDITNAGLVHIGATCKNLLEFECSRSLGVDDEGVAAITSGCRYLKKVVVSCCESITDASLQALATLKDLQTLELWACKQVTSLGFFYIAASCKHLRELDVGHCSLVGDPGVLALSHGCQNLRKINISNTSMTDVGMLVVAGMPCLQAMELGHMNVSIDDVVMAIRICGSLKYLKLPIVAASALNTRCLALFTIVRKSKSRTINMEYTMFVTSVLNTEQPTHGEDDHPCGARHAAVQNRCFVRTMRGQDRDSLPGGCGIPRSWKSSLLGQGECKASSNVAEKFSCLSLSPMILVTFSSKKSIRYSSLLINLETACHNQYDENRCEKST